jgi:IclR family acetate operon transcriptional repressor
MGSLSTEELHRETGIPRSSVYRVLCILEGCGYVARMNNGAEDGWNMDLKFLGLSANILSRMDLRTEIRDILVKLADDTKEIVQLALFNNEKVVIVDNVRKHRSIINVAHEGTALEINECVAGLVFGAYMDGSELDELLKHAKFPRLTEFTITDPKKLRAEFDRVRKIGYAVDDQYYAIGQRCIGAPVFDHTGRIAAEINISAHIRTISDDRIEALAAKVKKRAREASIRMGYTGRA